MTYISAHPTAPNTRPIMYQDIPHGLKELDQWASWRWEQRYGKWTKPPINPATGCYARNNDPDTWGSFEAALQRMREDQLPGIGFMFHPDDPFAGVDLDKCRDPQAGEIEPWALAIAEGLDSYTEISPSETGVKVFVRGELPPGRRRKGRIEMYDRGRFFTTTGHRLFGSPSNLRVGREELTTLHHQVFGEPTTRAASTKRGVAPTNKTHSLSDAELIDRAVQAANGEKFARLWAGDTSGYMTTSNEGRSEADLALCSLLAFWCGPDEARIDALFRRSGLMRQKWDRADYRALTLAVALDREEFWGSRLSKPRRRKVYARRKKVIRLA